MKTEQEIQDWLAKHMPDGPDSAYQQGIQDALDWVTGVTPGLEP